MHADAISITISVIQVDEPIVDLQRWLENISIGEGNDGQIKARIYNIMLY